MCMKFFAVSGSVDEWQQLELNNKVTTRIMGSCRHLPRTTDTGRQSSPQGHNYKSQSMFCATLWMRCVLMPAAAIMMPARPLPPSFFLYWGMYYQDRFVCAHSRIGSTVCLPGHMVHRVWTDEIKTWSRAHRV